MSKSGYGTFSEIKNDWTAEEVIDAMAYDKFLSDYESKLLELNK